MDFQLTEEQLAVQAAARDFAQNDLLPGVIERDTHEKFPAEQIKKMGELGFMGMMVDPKYNGGGMDTISYVLAMEEISKIDSSASVAMSVNNSLVCWGLEKFGTEEQKEKYLKRLATGEILGAFCLSEPEAGSDATSQRTTAEDKGDHYLVNGTKNWITNGNSASVYLVIAQTDKEKGHKGINALIVEKDMDGFVVGKKEEKLGIRGSAFKLADMATQIETARLLCLKAAWLKDQKQDFSQASAMAKLFASQVAMDTTVEAVQVHGGYGFVKEYHVERLMRDAKITQIYEGTSEIQKIVISRNILK